MKRITLKKMRLKNFKGVRSLDVDFGPTTSVFGRNGTGKTTIYDAFTWVLFDKDSRSCGSFQIATNDQQGNFIPRLEHEVSITLDIDGEETRLTKRIADKWVTQRGTTTPRLKGWESAYQINDVPCRKQDFDKFVADICGYDTFKMVTMPGYFMSKPENERRALLLNMAGGDITASSIVANDNDLESVIKMLENRTYEEVNKQLASEKSKYKKERDALEIEINNESNKVRHDLPTIEEVQQMINEGEQMIRELDSQISDRTSSLKAAQQHNKDRQTEITNANNEVARLIRKRIDDATRRKNTLEVNIAGLTVNITGLQNAIDYLKKESNKQLAIYEEKAKLRDEFINKINLINAEEFRYNENEMCCPVCKRPFEGESAQEQYAKLQNNFLQDKAERLRKVQREGRANSDLRDQAQQQNALYLKEIATKKQQIEDMQSKIDAWGKELETLEIPTEEYLTKVDVDVIAAVNKRDRLMESAESELPSVDVSDLQNKQQEIRQRQGQLYESLAQIKRNNHDKESVLAKTERFTEISARIAEIEMKEDKLLQYSRKRAMMLEERVNRMFSMVTFKFLIEQINGGIKEVCEPYYNGSPYSTNLNNGARINAGIDICTAIAKYYGIEAPIFVDNAEASNTFIPTESQLIKLIVSEDDQLRILTDNQQ